MAINRRQFVQMLALTGAATGTGCLPYFGGELRWLSCATNANSEHFLLALSEQGELLAKIRLPERGHDIAIAPNGKQACVFARRPDEFIVIVDTQQLKTERIIKAAMNRHFYGHGVFNHDGNLLYASENDYQNKRGVIGIYNATLGYQRVGELPSYGVGPHQIKMHPTENTLIVANGGLATHPDTGRTVLNLDSMQANLSYIDLSSGLLLRSLRLVKWAQLSIRHIDVSQSGNVAVAMQYHGERWEEPPLVAVQNGNSELQAVFAPNEVQRSMQLYCGSVCFGANNDSFWVSSPRGNVLSHWSTAGQFLDSYKQTDVCGLAASRDDVVASDGTGGLVEYTSNRKNESITALSQWRFDNHLSYVA